MNRVSLYSYSSALLCFSLLACSNESCPADKPIQSGLQCIACPEEKPLFENGACTACPTDKPLFRGGQCVTCYEENGTVTGCSPAPGQVATCTADQCSYSCAEGYDDCNQRADDGCEVRLNTTEHCRTCNDRCSENTWCTDSGCASRAITTTHLRSKYGSLPGQAWARSLVSTSGLSFVAFLNFEGSLDLNGNFEDDFGEPGDVVGGLTGGYVSGSFAEGPSFATFTEGTEVYTPYGEGAILQKADGSLVAANRYVLGTKFGTDPPAPTGESDGYLVKLHSNFGVFDFDWMQPLSGSERELVLGMTAHTNGDTYVVGSFTKDIRLLNVPAVSSLDEDAFMAIFGEDGAPKKLIHVGGSGSDLLLSVAVDSNGNSYAVGLKDSKALVASWDAQGTLRWQRVASSSSESRHVVIGNSGEVWVAIHASSHDFGFSPLMGVTDTPLEPGTTDMYDEGDVWFLRFNATDGAILGGTSYDISGNDYAIYITTDSKGRAVIIGNSAPPTVDGLLPVTLDKGGAFVLAVYPTGEIAGVSGIAEWSSTEDAFLASDGSVILCGSVAYDANPDPVITQFKFMASFSRLSP